MFAFELEIDMLSIQGVCDFQVCGFTTDSDEMDMVSRSWVIRGPDNVDWPFVVPPPRKMSLTSVWFM